MDSQTNMSSVHDAMGRVQGYAVIDIVGTVLPAAWLAYRFEWPVFPTILSAFILGEIVHYALQLNTPALSQLGITFFPAPTLGRHLNNRACNCK